VHVAQIGKSARGGARLRADETLRALQPAARIGRQGRKTDRRIEAVAGAGQEVKELDNADAPSRDVGGEFFEQTDRALAAAIVDGLADVDAASARVEARDEVRGEQIADVVDHPVVAALDRLVLPQAVDAPADNRRLCSDAIDELAQRTAPIELGRVFRAIERRQQRPQLLAVPGVVAVGVSGYGAPAPW